jgi:apolipoprotein N-acyltransferase
VKDRLVPYQEYAPYPCIMPRLSPVGIDFQFSKRLKNRQIYCDPNRSKSAALICYELVYSYLFREASRKGAEAFFVILNEGWYRDPKVPRQFLQLSMIRAIENRRYITHASNLGISAFINQYGKLIDHTDCKEPSFLKNEIRMNKKRTFSAMMGNYIEITSVFILSVIIILKFKTVIIIFNK